MKPGPEMDAAVARAVGCVELEADEVSDTYTPAYLYKGEALRIVDGCDEVRWCPSTDVADAIAALEATGCDFVIDRVDDVWDVILWERHRVRDDVAKLAERWGDTLPEAACRAILAWAEEKEKQG